MVSGHSYLPNDRDFGSIEKANRKRQHVYVPEEWSKLVETCRKKNPFTVTRMKTEDFISTSQLRAQIVYRKKNTNKEKVDWLSIRWLQFKKDKPFQIFYKYSHNDLEAWKIIDVKRKSPGRPPDMGRIALPLLYGGPRPINEKKLKDIQELLEFVPPVYHEFHEALIGTAAADTSSSED